MECLNVSEPEVVAALLRWGRAQLEADAEQEVGENLRRKIESCLELIRLPVLNHLEFTKLSQELGKVLSCKERLKIMECITLDNWDSMPAQIASLVSTSRTKPTVAIQVPFVKDNLAVHSRGEFKSSFSFRIDKKANFVGFLSLPSVDDNQFNANAFTRFYVILSKRNSGYYEIIRQWFYNTREQLVFDEACVLEANVDYTFTFYKEKLYDGAYFYHYNLNRKKNPVKNEWLSVYFNLQSDKIGFKLDEIIFELPR